MCVCMYVYIICDYLHDIYVYMYILECHVWKFPQNFIVCGRIHLGRKNSQGLSKCAAQRIESTSSMKKIHYTTLLVQRKVCCRIFRFPGFSFYFCMTALATHPLCVGHSCSFIQPRLRISNRIKPPLGCCGCCL